MYWLGHLHDDVTLALIYSAADVMVVPSRQDNLPQTGIEAQTCGCPVVAFNCAGLPDIADTSRQAIWLPVNDSDDLASGIKWVIENKERHATSSSAARERALRLWFSGSRHPMYKKIYEKVCCSGQE